MNAGSDDSTNPRQSIGQRVGSQEEAEGANRQIIIAQRSLSALSRDRSQQTDADSKTPEGFETATSTVARADEAAASSAEARTLAGTGSLILGYHSFATLEGVDLPAYVKEHNTTLSFPEKLMLLLTHVEREVAKSGNRPDTTSIGWVLGGKAFVIREKEHLVKTWLPMFFSQGKFTSFTRKLYRWGFRKINMTQHDGKNTDIFFGNENFQRDNKDLMSSMRSVTAAKTRGEMAAAATTQAAEQPTGHSKEFTQLVQSNPAAHAGAAGLQTFPPPANASAQEMIQSQHTLLQQALTAAHFQRGMIAARQLSLQAQDAVASQYLLSLASLTQSQVARNPQHISIPPVTQGISSNNLMAPQQAPAPSSITQTPSASSADERRLGAIMELFLRSPTAPAPPPPPPPPAPG